MSPEEAVALEGTDLAPVKTSVLLATLAAIRSGRIAFSVAGRWRARKMVDQIEVEIDLRIPPRAR